MDAVARYARGIAAATIAGVRRLITISISHYCEKARWALDRAGLEYREEAHLPNLHYLASFWIAHTPSLPILVDAGNVVPDSTAILHHVDGRIDVDRRLFPREEPMRAEVERLEELFDTELGPPARVWAYWHWFGKTREMLHYAGHGVPRLERLVAPPLLGVMKLVTGWRFSIDRAGAERALARVHEVFDQVDRVLADGRRYLVGDRFSAADLGFAALGAPLLLPVEHGVPLPRLDEAPPTMQDEIARLRARPAGTHVMRLYATCRRQPASPAA